jgi:hypothetical protein
VGFLLSISVKRGDPKEIARMIKEELNMPP